VEIHSSAVIHPGAVLGENVKIGPFSIIGSDVRIGDNTEIISSVRIDSGTSIGKNCRIFHGACIGGEPQIVDFRSVPSSVIIGDDTTIGEYATVQRSGEKDKATRLGRHCMLMAYAHVGHDCQVGDHVVIANNSALGGAYHRWRPFIYFGFGGYSSICKNWKALHAGGVVKGE